jgi:hypothetical protein
VFVERRVAHPLKMALALLPTGLLVALSAPFAGTMIDRVRHTPVHRGRPGRDVGGIPAVPAHRHPPGVRGGDLPTAILLGVGFALGFPSINVQATAVDDDEQGLAAGMVQTAGQVGAALVLAVTTAIIAGDGRPARSAADVLADYRPGLVFTTFVAAGRLLMTRLPYGADCKGFFAKNPLRRTLCGLDCRL